MCKVGDIILVKEYKSDDVILNKHSFIIIDDENGKIQGLEYNFVCNVMSSFKDEKHKLKKLSYPGNFEVHNKETSTDRNNGKDGFVKADQFYYFNKDKLNYERIGNIDEDFLKRLFEFIESLDQIEEIIDNL